MVCILNGGLDLVRHFIFMTLVHAMEEADTLLTCSEDKYFEKIKLGRLSSHCQCCCKTIISLMKIKMKKKLKC